MSISIIINKTLYMFILTSDILYLVHKVHDIVLSVTSNSNNQYSFNSVPHKARLLPHFILKYIRLQILLHRLHNFHITTMIYVGESQYLKHLRRVVYSPVDFVLTFPLLVYVHVHHYRVQHRVSLVAL